MLDFVEAMNKGVRFTRKFSVLKDRDLTGELKDIWAVIQAKRDAEKGNCINNDFLPSDENSQPCSPRPICFPYNGKYKR